MDKVIARVGEAVFAARVKISQDALSAFIALHPTLSKGQVANRLDGGDLEATKTFVRWGTVAERASMTVAEKRESLAKLDAAVADLQDKMYRMFSPLTDAEEARGVKIIRDHFPSMVQEVAPLIMSIGKEGLFDAMGMHGNTLQDQRERIGLSLLLAGVMPDAAKAFRITAGHEVFHAVLTRLERRFGVEALKNLYDAAQQDHIKQQVIAYHKGLDEEYYTGNPEEMLVEAYGMWLEGTLTLNEQGKLGTFFNRLWAATLYLLHYLAGDRLLAEAFASARRGEADAMMSGREVHAIDMRDSSEARMKAGHINYDMVEGTPRPATYGEVYAPLDMDKFLAGLRPELRADPLIREWAGAYDRSLREEKIRSWVEWTPEQMRAYEEAEMGASTEKFSRLSGYSEASIANFKKMGELDRRINQKYDEEETLYLGRDIQELIETPASEAVGKELEEMAKGQKRRDPEYIPGLDDEPLSKHNAAFAGEETLDTFGKEEQAHLTNEIEKILGKDVEVAFKGMKNAQGSWSKTKKRISLAITHDFVASNAFHEAFHGAADLYLHEDQFKQLYKFFDRPSIKKQIREFLKDSPDAWEAARDDPRELMAYGYQMFHAGVLNMEPEYQGTIGKILQYLADKFRRVNAWLRMQDTDRGLLEKIKQGYFADGKASAVELALANDPRLRAQARRITAEAFKTLDKIYESAFYPYDKRLRDMGNPIVSKLAKILYTQVGEKRENRGLLQERPMQMKRFLNAYDALRQAGPDVFDRTLGEMAAGQAPGDAAMAKSIRGWLDSLHAYGAKAGIEMGYVKDYIPMSWSGEKVKTNRAGFIAILERHMEDIARLNAHLAKQNPHKKFVKLTPANIADLMEKRGTHTGEVLGTTYDAQGAPEAFHTLDRVFGFLNNEERRPFMHDNLNGELQNYVKRLVNRAEYVRHFGNASEGWDSMIAEAKEYGLSEAEEKLIHDYKDTIFGKKLADMNPTLRKIYGINTAYQNYRVLGASVMSNLIDPFGIAIRSGEWNDAWESYKLAISRMFKEGRDKTQGLENLAKMIGVMETAGAADSLSELYGGVNIEGKAKWWNDKLFQWNGMDGLTKSVRLAGVRGGIDFIKRHGPGQGVSKDHLAELGLRPGDVMVKDEQLAIMPEQFTADHGLTSADALVKSERIQRAINRFVDEAVLRPNAGERTYWGSLPELAPLYHLKQYMFSFNHVINKKLEHEAFERGDTTPYMMASTYVPIMAASTFVKDLILGGGSVPAGKTFTDYMLGGLGKSGLLGPVEMAEWGAMGAASGDPMHIKQALGPTVSQAIEAMGALGAMGQKSMGGFMTESLPLGSILKHPL